MFVEVVDILYNAYLAGGRQELAATSAKANPEAIAFTEPLQHHTNPWHH